MFVYHFCAQKDSSFYDGIAHFPERIVSYADYTALRERIAKEMGVQDQKTVVLTSLSFLYYADKVK